MEFITYSVHLSIENYNSSVNNSFILQLAFRPSMDFIYSLLLIFPDKYGSSNSIIFAVKDKELENTSAVFIAYKYEMKVKLCPENVPAVWN